MYTLLNLAFLKKTYQLTNSFHRWCTCSGTYIYIFLTFLFLLSIRILHNMYNLSCVERSFRFFSLCASIQMMPQWNKCRFIFGTGTSICVRYMLVNKILIQKIFAVLDILFHKYMSERIQVTVYLRKFFAVKEVRVELRTFRISHSQFRWLWRSSGTAVIIEWKQLTCTCCAEGDLGKTGVQPTKTFLSGFAMKSMCLVFNLELNFKNGEKNCQK